MSGKWKIFVVTDTGRMVPHWTSENRRDARERLKSFKAAYPNAEFKLVRQ